MRNIAVIGAGITGVTTAYALTLRGYAVTALDRHGSAAMETSFANGGQLSASNAEVWNQWATVMQGLRWMFRSDAPLLINPRPEWRKYAWLADFVANVGHYRANTIATARLALDARALLFEIAEREAIDFDFAQRGILHVFGDREGFEKAERANRLLVEAGVDRYPVTAQEAHSIEPAFKGPVYGGLFTPDDSTGDIHKFCRGLAEACAKRGVQFLFDRAVKRITPRAANIELEWESAAPEKAAGHLVADGLVICAGVGSRRLAAMLGDRVNIYPVKGYSITVDLDDAASRAAAPWVGLADDDTKIVASRLGENRLRIAGTAEFNGCNRDIRADRIEPLVRWSRHAFPGLATGNVTPWSGLRPMMPDMMPRVGAGKRPRVFYNTGHGHLGWTLAAATAEMVASQIAASLP